MACQWGLVWTVTVVTVTWSKPLLTPEESVRFEAVSGRDMGQSETSNSAQRFMWAVQALALPAEEQLRLYPGFAESSDELALDFEEAHGRFLDAREVDHLSAAQREAVALLDAQLDAMSGPQHLHFWTDEGLLTASEWVVVRELAARVLEEMDWPPGTPPGDRAIYVGPPKSTLPRVAQVLIKWVRRVTGRSRSSILRDQNHF